MRRILILVSCLVLFSFIGMGADVNAPAPDFTQVDMSGKTVSLSHFKGKNVVLLFYLHYS